MTEASTEHDGQLTCFVVNKTSLIREKLGPLSHKSLGKLEFKYKDHSKNLVVSVETLTLSVFVSVGVELNSFYSEEDNCCIQFLHCLHCDKFRTQEVEPLAAEIKLAGEFSKYQTGQVCKTFNFRLYTV